MKHGHLTDIPKLDLSLQLSGSSGIYVQWLLNSSRFAMRYFLAEPRSGAPCHWHHYDEAVFIIRGVFEVKVSNETLVLMPSDFLLIERKEPHSIRNIGNSTGEYLNVISIENDMNIYPIDACTTNSNIRNSKVDGQ